VRGGLAAIALASGALGVAAFASAGGAAGAGGRGAAPASAGEGSVAAGARLFASTCSSCHGLAARGVPGRGPSLRGVGALAADFYLRTGRMPLASPHDVPVRADPQLSDAQIRDLVAYVASFGGPAIPRPGPSRGTLARGRQVFESNCAGCHQIVARGGIVTGAVAPALGQATPTDVAEAIRIGPYLMPRFPAATIDRHDVDALTRYVEWTRHPDDAGGWSIGNLGPIPEGMVAWLIAIAALVALARLVGDGTPER
jgi:ubiquinol-cytochrome c reductase cytochrome c subunit